jgi:hypothetical protein
MNARPDQVHVAHQVIEQERHTRHVARTLEQEDEQEDDHDLRQEHQHPARTGDHPIDQQAAQRSLGHLLRQPLAERAPCRP